MNNTETLTLLRIRYCPHIGPNRPAPTQKLWSWVHVKKLKYMLDRNALCFSAPGTATETPVSECADALASAEDWLRILGDLESMRRMFVSNWYMSDPQTIANSSSFGNEGVCVGTTYDRLIRSINHASTNMALVMAEGRYFSDGLVE